MNPAALLVLFALLLVAPAGWVIPILAAMAAWSATRLLAARPTVRRGAARVGDRSSAPILLGFDAGGNQVELGERELSAHGLILGASGAGKSTSLLAILSEQIVRGAAAVAIDLK